MALNKCNSGSCEIIKSYDRNYKYIKTEIGISLLFTGYDGKLIFEIEKEN